MSMTEQEKEVVGRVADLIKTYCSVQCIAGECDYLPHAISYALKQGFIKCQRCMGTGKMDLLHGRFSETLDSTCHLCRGIGKIPFNIDEMPQ